MLIEGNLANEICEKKIKEEKNYYIKVYIWTPYFKAPLQRMYVKCRSVRMCVH